MIPPLQFLKTGAFRADQAPCLEVDSGSRRRKSGVLALFFQVESVSARVVNLNYNFAVLIRSRDVVLLNRALRSVRPVSREKREPGIFLLG